MSKIEQSPEADKIIHDELVKWRGVGLATGPADLPKAKIEIVAAS